MSHRYHQRRNEKSLHKDERGVALAFFAVTAIAIIVMIGLAFDSYMATTSKSQYQSAADATALAMIEEYASQFDASANNRDGAITLAINKGGEILQDNVGVLLTSSYLQDTSATQGDVGTISSAGQNGKARPGFWVIDEDDIKLADCDNGGPIPCFAPLNLADVDERPNAFHVSLELNPTSRIRTTFMSLLGIEDYTLRAEAIALKQSRRGVFLIDLSPSIHESTHTLFPPTASALKETLYAYPVVNSGCLSRNYPLPSDIYHDPGAIAEQDPRTVFTNLDENAPNFPNFNGMAPGGRPVDALNNPINVSYQDDFRCYSVNLAPDEAPKIFAVDIQRRPEPLATIIEGVHNALDSFKGRALAGDSLGVFGFDDRQDGFLRIRSTYDSTASVPVLANPDGLEYENITVATEKPYNRGQQPSIVDKFLFPQFLSNNDPANPGDPVSTLATDIGAALRQATNVLDPSSSEFKTSENFVVLFSDGKSNCVEDGTGGFNCHGTRASIHKTSIGKVLLEEVQAMADQGITFHTVLVSDNVQPHNLLRVNPDRNGCLDDLTSRRIIESDPDKFRDVFSYVDYGNGDGDASGLVSPPYHYPNKFYDASSRTGGLWAPLRQPCIPDGPDLLDTTSSSGVAGALHRSCVNKGATSGTDPGAILSVTDLVSEIQADFTANGLLDDDGRLLCDPHNRTLQEQVEDFVDLLLGYNPIRLVGRD